MLPTNLPLLESELEHTKFQYVFVALFTIILNNFTKLVSQVVLLSHFVIIKFTVNFFSKEIKDNVIIEKYVIINLFK